MLPDTDRFRLGDHAGGRPAAEQLLIAFDVAARRAPAPCSHPHPYPHSRNEVHLCRS
ncbi:hypothetical protein ACIP4W_23180 [Streptomyces sp. NPDC088846]|uniref:hypothetical protein n=1 Tax=Streptomyces sp. NPDC088846 TaxID=3365908 RepID=UPI0037F2D870